MTDDETVAKLVAALDVELPTGTPTAIAMRDLLATVARQREVLLRCWNEYEGIMPDDLYDAVRGVLRIRVFTAEVSGEPDA